MISKHKLFVIGIFTSFSIYAQKTNEYKFLTKGQYNSKIYEKFETKDGDKVNLWHKVEESLENSPGIAFTEFYLQIDCKAKASILKTSITHWRDGTVQKLDDPSNKEVPITDLKSIPGLSYKKYCRK
ncbi:hypothetical protein SAMN05421841_2691 [Chryseobacterium wanjuense]|jgi:hypothetical protein|uniref:Uncharacterized protein n=1 Tax=Chryseobacterium wanjuense TaxID=356305 RepID=A0A1I0RHX1_9FLAO|nr:hypothetical protein [Chryseobacterium wanjuense]SEW40305.1 hypothetical protein SAMN05421841_2691 [Chryseobacterium wanjuense]